MSGSGDLHEELKMVLPAIQARKKMLDIKKTPDIFIDQVRLSVWDTHQTPPE